LVGKKNLPATMLKDNREELDINVLSTFRLSLADEVL